MALSMFQHLKFCRWALLVVLFLIAESPCFGEWVRYAKYDGCTSATQAPFDSDVLLYVGAGSDLVFDGDGSCEFSSGRIVAYSKKRSLKVKCCIADLTIPQKTLVIIGSEDEKIQVVNLAGASVQIAPIVKYKSPLTKFDQASGVIELPPRLELCIAHSNINKDYLLPVDGVDRPHTIWDYSFRFYTIAVSNFDFRQMAQKEYLFKCCYPMKARGILRIRNRLCDQEAQPVPLPVLKLSE